MTTTSPKTDLSDVTLEGAPGGARKEEARQKALPVPDLSSADAAFGRIDHMPEYSSLPDEFQRGDGPFCDAVENWFFKGAERAGNDLVVDGVRFAPKDGVDGTKALRAISAILRSFAPKQEHKIGGAGWLLSQWFDLQSGQE